MSAATGDPAIACPFCGSTDVSELSRFGTEISKEAYFCDACRSPFEYLKYDGRRPDVGR